MLWALASSHFAALRNNNVLNWPAFPDYASILNLGDDVHSFDDTTKHNVFVI